MSDQAPPPDQNVEVHALSKRLAFLDAPGTRHVIGIGLGVLTVILALLDFVIDRHPYVDAESTFGFYAWFGFGAFALVVLAGWPLRRFLARPPDYYSDEDA